MVVSAPDAARLLRDIKARLPFRAPPSSRRIRCARDLDWTEWAVPLHQEFLLGPRADRRDPNTIAGSAAKRIALHKRLLICGGCNAKRRDTDSKAKMRFAFGLGRRSNGVNYGRWRMTDQEALGSLITELIKLLHEGHAGPVSTQIMKIEGLFDSCDKSDAMINGPLLAQAERHFSNFKWLLGVKQRDRAITSLSEARVLLVDSARNWLDYGRS